MSIQAKRVLVRFILFALAGTIIEVYFTAAGKLLHGDWNMHGFSSPWMVFDYGLLAFAVPPIAKPLIKRGVPLAGRAAVYMIGIFIVEFVSGWIFDVAGLEIWDYSHLPYNVYGYITFTYIPCWYAAGLCVEWLYERIDAAALIVAAAIPVRHVEDLAGL